MNTYIKRVRDILTRKSKAYEETFSTDSGKLVLADLYRLCKTNNLSYVENSPDKTAFNEGAKYVALYIQGVLKQSPEDINKLLEEHAKKSSYNPLKGESNVRE